MLFITIKKYYFCKVGLFATSLVYNTKIPFIPTEFNLRETADMAPI